MQKFLYETTRRRRVYKLYIDWKTLNRRLVISNMNQYRADELRAKKVALDEKNKTLLTKKESTKEDYEKVIKEEKKYQEATQASIDANKQTLSDLQNKTSLKAYRDEQLKIYNESNTKADQISAQIASLDKKETKQRAELQQEFAEYYTKAYLANQEVVATNVKINNPNYYASDIKSTKAIIKQLEEDLNNSKKIVETSKVSSESADNTYKDFQKIREENDKQLKETEKKDVIANISGLKVDFDIHRELYGGTNKIVLRIYNLPKEYREALYQNLYLYTNNQIKKVMEITFMVGYEGDVVYNVFNGDLVEGYSYQQGLDIITEIQAWDTAIMFSRRLEETTLKENIGRKDLILNVLGSRLPEGKRIAGIDPKLLDDVVKAPLNLTLDAMEDIRTYAVDTDGNNMDVYVDNSGVYIVSQKSSVDFQGTEQSISSATNLLETPRFHGGTITCKCLLMPNIKPGQNISLYSEIDEFVSGKHLLKEQYQKDKKGKLTEIVSATELPAGRYKIASIHHQGSVSDTTESKAFTVIELQSGTLWFESLDITKLEVFR